MSDQSKQTSRSRNERRRFLKRAGGATGAAALFVAGCDDDDEMGGMGDDGVTLDFSNELDVLNYAYALEQLEAAFYAQVTDSFPSGFSDEDERIFNDLRRHEVIHRNAPERMLGDDAISGLTPNFESVDFDSRSSVLNTAQTFEDLGVSAYNGAGRYLTTATRLTLGGKIVSVEARHASVIRQMASSDADAFANLSSLGANAGQGLDVLLSPGDVLDEAGGFIEETITAEGLDAA